ncbi:MAG: hypothetical protein OXU25_01345 [Thaumarchaeota archaeon]|nr:hypothetical protein [Nitrososphaerota archaeon]
MERGQARDPQDGHAAMETPNGSSQTLAARWGAEQLAPRAAAIAALVHAMRRLGLRASAALVVKMAKHLDAILMPRTLKAAAKEAAAAHDVGDPRRPATIVAAQVRLVLAAGPAAVDAARALAEHAKAFSEVLAEWAAKADEYGRDGAAKEVANAVARKRFVRRPDDRFKFTAMSVDLRLRRHSRNQVKMYIQQVGILLPTHVVEYCPFRARLDTDTEEIDSPKAAVYAKECEVRMPDGARVAPDGIRVMARKRRLDARARGHLERLSSLEEGVEIKGL